MRGIKKYLQCFLCFVVLLVAPVLYVNAEATADPQVKSPIEVSDMKINKDIFKAGSNMKYRFTINNIGIDDYLITTGDGIDENDMVDNYGEPPCYYGSDTVYVYWKSTKKQYIVQAFKWKKSDKKKGILKISGKIPVKKGMKTGKWRMVALYFEYEGQEFWVKDNREKVSEASEVPMLDFSDLDFKVSGTGKADNKAPTLNLNSLKLSKPFVKNKQKSTFSVKVKDSSTIDEVVCVWDVYDKTNKSKCGDYYEFYTMKYNKKTKSYRCSVGLNSSYESKAQLVGIEVRDIYGNEKMYYSYKSGNKVSKYYKAYKNMVVVKK